MFAAARDDDLGGRVGQAVVPFEFVGDGLAQFRDAAGRSVFGEALVKRLGAGVLDVLGRVEIRFARAEADDVQPLGLHLLGLGINGQGERGRERGGACRDAIVHGIGRRGIATRAHRRKREFDLKGGVQ